MLHCFECGMEIENGRGVKRIVATGSTAGGMVTSDGSMGIGAARHESGQWFCARCAKYLDMAREEAARRAGRQQKMILIGIGVACLCVLLYAAYAKFVG